jgi:hypothetical protein
MPGKKRVYMKTRGMTAALFILFLGTALAFMGCNVLLGGEFETEKAGLFRVVNGEKIWEMTAGEINLVNCLSRIERSQLTGAPVDEYEIVLIKDEEFSSQYISPWNDASDKNNFAFKKITITARKKITLREKTGTSEPLLVIGTYDNDGKWAAKPNHGEVTLVLGPNITIKGSGSDNPNPLVRVIAGGNLIIQDGAEITGNRRVPVRTAEDSGSGGGGMEVFNGGKVIMNGGSISDNAIISSGHEVVSGGGILLSQNGSFTMNGGSIRNNSVSNSHTQGYAAGGGIAGYSGSLVLNGGVISGNKVESPSGTAYGGGVYLHECSFDLKGGSITGNSLTGGSVAGTYAKGGGIFVDQNEPFTPSGVSVENNTPDNYASHFESTPGGDDNNNTGEDGENNDDPPDDGEDNTGGDDDPEDGENNTGGEDDSDEGEDTNGGEGTNDDEGTNGGGGDGGGDTDDEDTDGTGDDTGNGEDDDTGDGDAGSGE